MVNIQGPSNIPPNDPYDKFRVHKVDDDEIKPNAKKWLEYEEDSSKTKILLTKFRLIFKKILTFFINPSEEELYALYIEDNLEVILKALEKLKTTDYSEDTVYLNFFSKAWHKFLEDTLQFQKDKKIFIEVEAFIEDLADYPKGEAHSFGYYLSEYAGSKWLPFPFMELLQNLHRDHKSEPKISQLSKWTERLREIINEIQIEKIL